MTLRLLEVTQRYPPALGGVEQHVQRLGRAMVRAGLSVEVLTTDLARDQPFARLPAPWPAEEPPVRRRRAVRIARAPHGLGILAPAMVLDALRSQADVVHAHAFGYFPSWAATIGRRSRGGRLVITPHADVGRGTSGSRTYARLVAAATLRQADRVIAQSRRERALLESIGVAADRIEQIPTPFDLSEFPSFAPRSGRTGPPVAVFVGRLYLRQKGLDVLLRAVARLPRDSRPQLRFVGEDWGGQAVLESLAAALGVDHLVFTGPVDRHTILRELARADLFVLPSRFDSFPVVLLEAMAAGLPVVASDVGAVAEVVADGETGYVVPAGDEVALAGAVARLVADPGLRERLGKAGRDLAPAYSWEALAPRYAAMFGRVAAGN